jgi:serine protease Do
MITLAFALMVSGPTQALAENPPNFSALVKQYGSAVVNIRATRIADAALPGRPNLPPEMPEFFERFFKQFPDRPNAPGPHGGRAQGSGFIISEDGYILSNAHVVAGAKEITVRLRDRRELPAKLIGADERTDVALLKVDADNLPIVELGDSDQVDVGEWVLAIGAPFGFENTATQGIVSALSRSLPNGTYVPFIQTDVAVNPGNSGGPLFDSDGNVIGINSQIYSNSGGYMGVSFAIPINVAMNVADQLKARGFVSRGWLGVAIQDMDQDLAKSFGLDTPSGALVANVTDGGPAERAGIEAGDVILRYHGKPVNRSGDLPPLVGETAKGVEVEIEVLRNGKRRTLEVEIGELEDAEVTQLSQAAPADKGALGVAAANLDQQQRETLGVGERGVLVRNVNPESPAAEAGVLENDIILSFNRADVKNVKQLKRLIEEAPTDQPIAMLIMRDQRTQFLPVTIPESVS